jgi:predicted O-methyltransferase YrrM
MFLGGNQLEVKMKCFIDGDCLCVVKDDFVNLQESKDVVFIDLTKRQIKQIKHYNEQ